MNILEILILVLAHWVSDYCFQTEKQGLEKSKNLKLLVFHTLTYSFVMFLCLGWANTFKLIKLNSIPVFRFFIATFVLHTLTDYFTSKLTSYYYKKKKMYGFPGFWTIIGFDQVLHLFQLFITYHLLK